MEKELSTLVAKVSRLFRSKKEHETIQLMLDDKVYSEYEIPINHYVSRDGKTATEWVRSCVTWSKIKGEKGAFSLRMKQK